MRIWGHSKVNKKSFLPSLVTLCNQGRILRQLQSTQKILWSLHPVLLECSVLDSSANSLCMMKRKIINHVKRCSLVWAIIQGLWVYMCNLLSYSLKAMFKHNSHILKVLFPWYWFFEHVQIIAVPCPNWMNYECYWNTWHSKTAFIFCLRFVFSSDFNNWKIVFSILQIVVRKKG